MNFFYYINSYNNSEPFKMSFQINQQNNNHTQITTDIHIIPEAQNILSRKYIENKADYGSVVSTVCAINGNGVNEGKMQHIIVHEYNKFMDNVRIVVNSNIESGINVHEIQYDKIIEHELGECIARINNSYKKITCYRRLSTNHLANNTVTTFMNKISNASSDINVARRNDCKSANSYIGTGVSIQYTDLQREIDKKECSICTIPYNKNMTLQILPCEHMFCIECARKSAHKCPLCRHPFNL